MRKKRVIPMPTEEEKARAKLKAESMDPLVWAMKSVDKAFPDSRVKNETPIMDDDDYDDYEDDEDGLEEESMARPMTVQGMEPQAAANAAAAMTEPAVSSQTEIKAEGKLAVPADDGVLTMEVLPMRQDVSDVSPDEVRARREGDFDAEAEKKSRKGFFKNLRAKKEEPVGAEGVHKISPEEVQAKKIGAKDADEKKEEPKKGALIAKVKGFDASQKKMMIAIGAMSIAAVAGILFGVVSIVRQGETTKELTEQIAEAQNNAKMVAQENTADGDYINLKDWGLRIKVATGLTYISYNYASDAYSEVMIWGAKRDASANYSPEFVNQSKNSSSMGTVVRVPRYERAAAGRLIWYDDYYNYYYQGPSGVPNVSEDEMSWWVDSYLLIKEMLTNADNYEKYEQNTIGQS